MQMTLAQKLQRIEEIVLAAENMLRALDAMHQLTRENAEYVAQLRRNALRQALEG